MIRIAATGDIHYDKNSHNRLGQHLIGIEEKADILLLAGDLTQTGHPDEMRILAEDLKKCSIPTIAVFGNHDYHLNEIQIAKKILTDSGVVILEASSVTMNIGEKKIGIAGLKGFGGGFVGACGSEFGEEEMKAFMRHSKKEARQLEEVIKNLNTDYKIVLLHYSPIEGTLTGERKEIYPFLGNYFLAEAIDYGKASICFHGHAHSGIERGETPGGIPVRNVAQPVIRHAFNTYTLN